MFFFVQEALVCNFADDNSLYASAKSQIEVVVILESEIAIILEWFKFNSMAPNTAKFQLMFLGRKCMPIKVKVGNCFIEPTDCVKLLGVYIDSELSFTTHVQTLCKSASCKIKSLFHLRPFLNTKAYILSPFNYCPLI